MFFYLPPFLQMYFIIAPDWARTFPSGVTRNGIWPKGALPAKINSKKSSFFYNIWCFCFASKFGLTIIMLWVQVIYPPPPRGRGGGENWPPHIYTERPHPEVWPPPFYTPFLAEKVLIPFYCCKCHVFQIWINHKNRKFIFLTFSHP